MDRRTANSVSPQVCGLTLTLDIYGEWCIVPACIYHNELLILNEKGIFVIRWVRDNSEGFLEHLSNELKLEHPLERIKFLNDSFH